MTATDGRFTVLHVCMGNICRSPLSERLLLVRLSKHLGNTGPDADDLVFSHSAAMGPWHVGEPMARGSARQLAARGGDPTGFRARLVESPLVRPADLILTATVDQSEGIAAAYPEQAGRTFVSGEFGRLAAKIAATDLPPYEPTAEAVRTRGRALVAAVNKARGASEATARDEVDDPYGCPDHVFSAVADVIEAHLTPLADRLLNA